MTDFHSIGNLVKNDSPSTLSLRHASSEITQDQLDIVMYSNFRPMTLYLWRLKKYVCKNVPKINGFDQSSSVETYNLDHLFPGVALKTWLRLGIPMCGVFATQTIGASSVLGTVSGLWYESELVDIIDDGPLYEIWDQNSSSKMYFLMKESNWIGLLRLSRFPAEQNVSMIKATNDQVQFVVDRNISPNEELTVFIRDQYYERYYQHDMTLNTSKSRAEETCDEQTLMSHHTEEEEEQSPYGIGLACDGVEKMCSISKISSESLFTIQDLPISSSADGINLKPDGTIDGESASGYSCNKCGKLFSYKYYLERHLKFTKCMDAGDKQFRCTECSRSFEKEDRLRIHIQHVHLRMKPYSCKVCGKRFSQSSSLSKHNRIHTGERPYKCNICAKSFTASSILHTHMRQHTGEKPFKCRYCERKFASHAAHDSHFRRYHQNEN